MNLFENKIFIIINIIVHIIIICLILKNKNYSGIYVRSPILLTLSNLFLCLMSSSLLLNKYYLINETNNYDKLSKNLMILFYFSIFGIFLSLIFRIRRFSLIEKINIIITNNYENKTTKFYNNLHKLYEKFYLLIFLIFHLSVLLIFSFIKLLYKNSNYNLDDLYKKSYVLQIIILCLFIPSIYMTNLLFRIKFEYLFQMILYISIYPLIIYNKIEFFVFNQNYFCLLIDYFFLIISSYIPYNLSLKNKIKINYSFNPKLSKNLYLFLTDEICFFSLKNYLKEKNAQIFYLNLYTNIMKFKYKYTLESNFYNVLKDAKELYEKYFSENVENSFIDENILENIRNDCKSLIDKEDCTFEMFDGVLKFIYENLQESFDEYLKSENYKYLIINLNLIDYVKYKMCIQKDNSNELLEINNI